MRDEVSFLRSSRKNCRQSLNLQKPRSFLSTQGRWVETVKDLSGKAALTVSPRLSAHRPRGCCLQRARIAWKPRDENTHAQRVGEALRSVNSTNWTCSSGIHCGARGKRPLFSNSGPKARTRPREGKDSFWKAMVNSTLVKPQLRPTWNERVTNNFQQIAI